MAITCEYYLPPLVLNNIAKHLPQDNIPVLRLVGPDWRDAASQQLQSLKPKRRLTSEQVAELCKAFPNIRSLDLTACPSAGLLPGLPVLKHLRYCSQNMLSTVSFVHVSPSEASCLHSIDCLFGPPYISPWTAYSACAIRYQLPDSLQPFLILPAHYGRFPPRDHRENLRWWKSSIAVSVDGKPLLGFWGYYWSYCPRLQGIDPSGVHNTAGRHPGLHLPASLPCEPGLEHGRLGGGLRLDWHSPGCDADKAPG